MKRILCLLLLLSLLLMPFSYAEAINRVAASFYPVYIFAMNVLEGINDIELVCMTAPTTGCLHDYQLLTPDLITLSKSDALIICGAGMEPYLEDVRAQLRALEMIDCSEGIELIEEDGELNAHTWLDAKNAITIVRTIAASLSTMYPQSAEKISINTANYISKLEALDSDITVALAPYAGNKIVTFHEAFPYFAKAYGLEICAVISEEHEGTLLPSQLQKVIRIVKSNGNPPLFTEPQYESGAALTISAETGASIHELDPAVTGPFEADAYEMIMRQNIVSIMEAFAPGQEIKK